MTTALLCITFYVLGASSFGVLALLMIAHRRPPPPTFFHRRWRDAPGTEFQHVPPTVQCQAKATDDGCGVRYEWVNMTGEER